MTAKLKQVRAEIIHRRHLPVPTRDDGWHQWLRGTSRSRGACDFNAVQAFRTRVTRYWRHALRRRSQKTRLTWDRTDRLANPYPPRTRIIHPFPDRRFAAKHP